MHMQFLCTPLYITCSQALVWTGWLMTVIIYCSFFCTSAWRHNPLAWVKTAQAFLTTLREKYKSCKWLNIPEFIFLPPTALLWHGWFCKEHWGGSCEQLVLWRDFLSHLLCGNILPKTSLRLKQTCSLGFFSPLMIAFSSRTRLQHQMMVGLHVAFFCFDDGKWDIVYYLSREKDWNEQDDQEASRQWNYVTKGVL